MTAPSTFWLMDEPKIVLCDECALTATNMAVDLTELGNAFETMREAVAILDALSAIAGLELGITATEQGICDQCGRASE